MDQLSHRPALILIRGIPGSGKSTIAAKVALILGADHAVILDPDATDYTGQAYRDLSATLTAKGLEAKFFPYRFLRGQAETAIDTDKVIIWNQAFTLLGGLQRTIEYLQSYATDHDKRLPVLVVEVTIDPTVARQRLDQRASQGGHEVSDEAFARFINDYGSFAGEGHRTIEVNGADDTTASAATIIAALEQ